MYKRLILLTACFYIFYHVFAGTVYRENDSLPYSARLLSQYVKHPSVTGNERMAGLFFSTVARQKGLNVEILTDEPARFNFTASLYPLDMEKPNIVLLNHIDVVPAVWNGEYTYPPFSGTIADGKVWGRGSIDNKGMGVMQLLALEYFIDFAADNDLPYNVTMLSVSGEETGGYSGAKIITEEYIEYLNPVVVYGEGGAGIPEVLVRDPGRKLFGVSVTFKRSLWLELTLKMTTQGHSAVTPSSYVIQDKIQALNRLTERTRKVSFSESTRDMFRELGKIEGGVRGLALRNLRLFRPFVVPAMKREDIIFSLITNTATITSVNTPPGQPNQMPQEITAVLDCRLLPETTSKEFIKEIRRALSNEDMEIRILHEEPQTPPTKKDQFYFYMRDALHEVYPGSGVIPVLAPGSNDNNYFRAEGIPTYGMLPVFIPVHILETIHNVDERLPVDALEQGLNVYRALIKRILETGSEEPVLIDK